MEGVCTLNPTINGKESKLFKDIKKRVVTQEAAAFLYGIAQDDSIRRQFTKKSDFDSNNELFSKAFFEKFQLDRWIVSRNELLQERREQGVIDSRGNQVIFTDPDVVVDKITSYNSSQNKMRMKARWDTGAKGYVIDLDRVNINNYKTNEIMQRDSAKFRGYVSYLEKVIGEPVTFDDSTRKNFANSLNTKYFADTVIQLSKNLRNFGARVYLNEPQAALLLDLHRSSPFVERIKSVFGDNAVAAIVETSHMKDGDPDEMDPGYRELIRQFLRFVSNKSSGSKNLTKFSEPHFLAAGEDAIRDASISQEEYFGVNTGRITEIIADLRSKYMIDTKIKNNSLRSIKSLSDAANGLMQMAIRNIEKMRRLGMSAEDYQNVLSKRKADYDKGKYLDSIAGLLEEVRKTLDTNADILNAAIQNFESDSVGTTSIQGLNAVSSALINTIKLGAGYENILDSLSRLERLDLDERDLDENTKTLVKETAKQLVEELRSQVDSARRKQFDVLYAFYLPIWGGSDIKIDPEGGEHSLRDILNILAEDPNILDRLIYSLNESNDEALGLLHQAVLDRQRARDAMMRKVDLYVRQVTDSLYKAGSKSSFMYEMEDGLPTGRIKDIYGISKYKKARQAKIEELQQEDLSHEAFRSKLYEWDRTHTMQISPFINSRYDTRYQNALRNVIGKLFGDYDANSSNYAIDLITVPTPSFHDDQLADLTEAELDYYFSMMALKAVMQKGMPNYDTNFFEAPQMTNDFVSTLLNIGNNPGKMFSGITNYFSSRKVRDDEIYEETLGELLHGNGYKRVLEDIDGTELMRLPLFFTHRLKDKSNMSMDFSRTMLAMSSAAVNYNELNQVLDTLMLTKDWLINKRQTDKTEGERKLVDIFKWGRDIFMQSIMREENSESGLIVDFFEKDVYGKTKKNEEVNLFGVTVKLDRAADWLTGFTSRTGLTVNILGSQANLLVGKLQMTIEGFAGEFFNLADMGYAEVKYFQLLMPYLMEYNSNNKSSLLGILSDKFNVMEGYYEDLKQKGFQISALGKILSNTNLFLLYGMGEHLLHNETMLAILHRVKVRHKASGKEMNLLDAYEDYGVVGDANNKMIDLNYNDFEIWKPDSNGGSYVQMTAADEERVEKNITYCNKTMHGAFNDLEKGMASRYAFGRMVMNFRQWMPGHYGRRFRTMHYDADLGDYRQGFYQSSFKFVVDTVNDLRRAKFDIATHWKELSESEQANIKRAIAETGLMVILMIQNLMLGEYKDKRGSWAYRNLIYQTKRMLMEVKASTPLSGFGPQGFIANLVSMMNSPVAAVATIEDIVTLMDLTKLFVTIEGGRYDGENLYMHNLKRRVPYIGQIMRQAKIGEEDYIFQVFE